MSGADYNVHQMDEERLWPTFSKQAVSFTAFT